MSGLRAMCDGVGAARSRQHQSARPNPNRCVRPTALSVLRRKVLPCGNATFARAEDALRYWRDFSTVFCSSIHLFVLSMTGSESDDSVLGLLEGSSSQARRGVNNRR